MKNWSTMESYIFVRDGYSGEVGNTVMPRKNNQLIYENVCDRIWENPPYGIRARFAQSAFLVAQVENYQSPAFVIYMSSNPSSNCSRHLRRLVVSYQGEISLHFDPPSLYSCRVRIPLLREIIKIRARGLPRYSLFRRTTVRSLTF
jgi:hypothetical protein